LTIVPLFLRFRRQVQELAKNDIKMVVGVINDHWARYFVSCGCDGLVTDYPRELLNLVKKPYGDNSH